MKFRSAILTIAFALIGFGILAQSAWKRAEKEMELGAFDRAVITYKEILAAEPANAEANAGLATSYWYLNELELAAMHFENALAKPGMPDVVKFRYGLTLQGLGRYEQAKKIFDELASSSAEFQTRAKQFSEACTFALSSDVPSGFKIVPEYVNTPSSEFGPTFFKDKVVFASSRKDIRAVNGRNAPSAPTTGNRLFISQRDQNGFLQTPVLLHTGFGQHSNEGPVSYTRDHATVAYTMNNFRDGVRQIPHPGLELSLFLAQANSDGSWVGARAFEHNGSGYSTGYPCFAPDGNALYFASNRPGGYGGFDIYVSYRVGNSWSAPENLGPAVNTIGNEITPWFDGSTLYFASDYHKGFGGFDIFRAESNGGKWTTIYHMGTGINSSADDYGFIYDELRNVGYFVSNRPGGKGLEDIYRVVKEADNLVIKVIDAATRQPMVGATLDFSKCGSGVFKTASSGVFTMQLLKPMDCVVEISFPGYRTETLEISRLGMRANRTFEVAMVNINDSYEGRVVDAATGWPLADVKVIATERGTGAMVEALTDTRGAYLIALKPKAQYNVRFSKPGYQDVIVTLNTQPDNSRRLDDVGLLPVAGVAPQAAVARNATEQATVAVQPQARSASISATVAGYSVQVAAFSKAPNLDEMRTKLGHLGNVYAVQEGNTYKVRIGVFASREEAEKTLGVVKNQMKYTSAFIVPDTGQPAHGVVSTKPQLQPKSTVASQGILLKDGYAIQLGAFSDASKFDESKVAGLGEVHYVQRNNLTIVVLAGYDSRSTAEIVLKKVKALGYPGAFIVQISNGQLVK
ncbi:MAG: hypothetical protein KatS3mg030_318 [Saprospiraceae bacterium]|nr:MAG: hypothetical protein KatS3mg030_318 [Saprospiraceae bacterium]